MASKKEELNELFKRDHYAVLVESEDIHGMKRIACNQFFHSNCLLKQLTQGKWSGIKHNVESVVNQQVAELPPWNKKGRTKDGRSRETHNFPTIPMYEMVSNIYNLYKFFLSLSIFTTFTKVSFYLTVVHKQKMMKMKKITMMKKKNKQYSKTFLIFKTLIRNIQITVFCQLKF